MLRNDLAAHEQHHKRRDQRDRQDRGCRHREGLGESQRAEQAPLLRFHGEDRQERYRDDQKAEKQRRADLARGLDQDFYPGLVGRRAFEMLVGVLDHDDGAIDHGADRDRDAAKAHDVRADAERLHGAEGHQDSDRQHDDGDERAAHMQQEHDADQCYDDAFFRERSLERLDRAVNEIGAVIDRYDLHVFGKGRRHLGQPRLDVVDDIERVLAETLQRDAAGDLAFAVEFGNASSLVRPEFDPRHVLQQDRRSLVDLQNDVRKIGKAFDIAAATHDEFEFRQLHRAAADIHVAAADRVAHFCKRDIQCPQAVRIDDDVVLPDEAADAGHFGHAFRLGDAVADGPILQGSQVSQRFILRLQRILIDPADAGRVRSQSGRHAGGQFARRRVEIFKNARARPVDIGAILEDDVDERNPEERKAPHHLRFRHRQHRRRQRIGDLILDDLRRLTADIRYRRSPGCRRDREWRPAAECCQRIDAGGDREHRSDQRPASNCGPTSR